MRFLFTALLLTLSCSLFAEMTPREFIEKVRLWLD